MTSLCAVPAQDGNSAVGYIAVTRAWCFALCDHYVALLSHHLSVELNFILCIRRRRNNSKATAGSYCEGLLCALKSNDVHFCLKFFLFVVVKIFSLLNMFYSGVDNSYIHCLKKKLTWIMLSLVFKSLSQSQSCFELFMYLLHSLQRPVSIRRA